MELGIMEWAGIEAENNPHWGRCAEAVRLVETPPAPVLAVSTDRWYNVYFRDEYYGHVPEPILEDVKLYMGLAGGFDFDPATLTLRSLHKADRYRLMVQKITVRLNAWIKANGEGV